MTVESRKALEQIQPYTPGLPVWEVQQKYGLKSVVKLASNENPLGPSPKAIEAIQSSLGELHRYPDANTTAIRHAIGEKLGISSEQFIITNGGDELIKLISETYLEPGDNIIVPSPSFSEYEFGAHLMDAKVIPVPLDDHFRFDVPAILAAVTQQTKIIYVCSPNNPTGTYMTHAQLTELLQGLPKGIIVVIDGAYNHYADAADFTDGIEFVKENYPVVILHTFSKIFGLAGLRIGYGIAQASIIQQILKVKEPFNVNTLAQIAATAALTDEEHLDLSRQTVIEGRKQLYEACRELGLPYIESMGNFVLIELGPHTQNIYDTLLTKGIILRNGKAWGLPQHVRVSIGTKQENSFLIQELRTLLTVGNIK
ncbi:histidinol-phosphate aminotransferase [Paenibacillus baekrokdamisoli]|uniref:Histidinol-phosphate aminotransferase n=1 Tax=Paenibacillus baekrokdamisoli TaxID=1712516 RepID=A0A3G9JA68_9BACL|nr:histidinol-phosphate transaminase [Paenibacillus baekrokdamisoli]MBB3071698.1 histidinol-phosphate aminotransferase [Paenibacillus baekrokdamisoli]BBH21793.1 histidinol-phosphate aminotransferase [Paenibacillus baekrokdamisoli]